MSKGSLSELFVSLSEGRIALIVSLSDGRIPVVCMQCS